MKLETFKEIDEKLAQLTSLENEIENTWEANFIDDITERLDAYGVNTFLSTDQLKKIDEIHQKYIKES